MELLTVGASDHPSASPEDGFSDDLAVLGSWLHSVILNEFSNLKDSLKSLGSKCLASYRPCSPSHLYP